MTEKTKKRGFESNITVGGAGLDMAGLRLLAQKNPEGFMHKCQGLIDEGKLSWSKIRNLESFFHALSDVEVEARVNVLGRMRAVQSSAFPLLSGGLTVAGINAAYDAVPTVTEMLVEEIEDNKRSTNYARITSEDVEADRIEEGRPFPEVGAGEERYEIRSKRNGRRMTITAEMIEENDVANIVQKVNALGEIAAEEVEEQTLRRICDIDGSGTSPAEPYVLRPNGAGTSLYSSTANTPNARTPSGTRYNSNALVDTTDLDNVRARLASHLNDRGKRILIPASQCTIFVPDALVGTAMKIRGSELEPSVENELNNWGPRGAWQPKVLSTPKLDALSATVWYYGWFQKQFKRKWKLRFEFVTLEGNTQKFLESRIAFQSRIAWDTETGAVDSVYVIQSLSGTTAP